MQSELLTTEKNHR